MTRERTDRLAETILERWGPPNDPLVGDLLEEFAGGRSRWWLWRQVVAALAIRLSQPRPGPIRLELSDDDPFVVANGREGRRAAAPINLSAGPVRGVGGLGLVALAVLVWTTGPEAWWIPAAGAAAGLVLGIVLVVARRPHALPGASITLKSPPAAGRGLDPGGR